MRNFTKAEILAHRFQGARRSGYDTLSVDMYVEQLAEYLDWLHAQRDGHSTTVRTGIELLGSAHRVADETRTEAEVDAADIRGQAAADRARAKILASELVEEARATERAILERSNQERDRILGEANSHARAVVDGARTDAAAARAEAEERVRDLERVIDVLKNEIDMAARDLRSKGAALHNLADGLEQRRSPSQPIDLTREKVPEP